MSGDDADAAVAPRLAPHVRLAYDSTRGRWMLQAPERLLLLDDVAVEIVRRCDGSAAPEEIAAALAREFDAPAGEIACDVAELITDLQARGYLA